MTEMLQVLLLEDSRFDAELLRENLHAGYPRAVLEVVRDEDGFAAALARKRFDVILSDYELPGYNGGQALAHAQTVVPRTPFIFVSGVIGEDNAVELLKRGATDFVSKGRLARLHVVLERALREVAEREARENAERQLREADAMYARVVDSLRGYGVLLLDVEGRIRTWNRAAEDIFGYTAGQAIGQSARMLFPPQDRAEGAFDRELEMARSRGEASDNRWMLRADGTTFWAEGLVSALYHGDARKVPEGTLPSGFTKIVRDGTASHRAGQALRDARDEAERANLAKDRFLAVLSHELRTPLTPIGAAAHVLERSADVPAEHRHLLPMIRRNVALEARLIDDLLDLTAINAGKVHLKFGTVDMHRLVRVVVDMVADQISERQLRLRVDLNAKQALVSADEARMHQVVWNILRNAIKFTPPGGAVVLKTSSEMGQFMLECSDNGIGIEPKALSRIFTAFDQADADVSHKFGGLGLGLAIARGLVLEHHGELSARSEGRGQGATFTLMLDALPDGTAPQQDAPSLPADLSFTTDLHCRMLLVEDNPDSADILKMGLEAYGYTVTLAGTCAKALAVGGREDFDVVVTDLGLPDGSGIEIGRALSPRMPVIALSGYGSPQDVQRSTAAGFSGHIVKPADFTAVHSMVQRVLSQGTAGRPAVA